MFGSPYRGTAVTQNKSMLRMLVGQAIIVARQAAAWPKMHVRTINVDLWRSGEIELLGRQLRGFSR